MNCPVKDFLSDYDPKTTEKIGCLNGFGFYTPKGRLVPENTLERSKSRIVGKLDLSDFVNLRTLQLVKCNFFQPTLPSSLVNVQLVLCRISTDIAIFSRLVNCEILDIGEDYFVPLQWFERLSCNNFYGSLRSLKNLTKLKFLCIASQKEITQGLETMALLPNLNHFGCHGTVFAKMLGKNVATRKDIVKKVAKLRGELKEKIPQEQKRAKKNKLLIEFEPDNWGEMSLEELFEYYEKLKERNRKAEINETSSKVFSLYAKTNGKYPPWYRIDQHINNIANFTVETVGDLAIETKEKVSLAFRTIYWTALILILVTIFNFFFSINAITSAIRKFFVSKLKVKADKEEAKENQRLSN